MKHTKRTIVKIVKSLDNGFSFDISAKIDTDDIPRVLIYLDELKLEMLKIYKDRLQGL